MLRNIVLIYTFVALDVTCFAMGTQSELPAIKQSTNFSTARDISTSPSESHVKLHNTAATSTVVYGVYIRQFAYVTPGQSCISPTAIYSSTINTAAGAMVMPVTIGANSEVSIGANYLYNMIYNAMYYVQVVNPSSPPGCALPGCTWGSDLTAYNWCIYVGVIAPVTVTASYTSKVVPSTTTVSGGGYNYNRVSDYHYIGPITCNDQTLTCSLSTAQVQSF